MNLVLRNARVARRVALAWGEDALGSLGEEGWIRVLKLDEYAPRQPRRHDKMQQVLFPYTEAI